MLELPEIAAQGHERWGALVISWPGKLGIAIFAAMCNQICSFYQNAPDILRISAGLAVMLLLLDTLTGMIASVVARGERINSQRLRLTSLKWLVYGSCWILGLALDIGLRLNHAAQTGVFIYCAATEGLSSIENISQIGTIAGVKPPDFLSRLFKSWLDKSSGGKL